MRFGEANKIFTNIDSDEFNFQQKGQAIQVIFEMATHNSIRKDDILKVVKWMWQQMYEVKDSITNYDNIRMMSLDEMSIKFASAFDIPSFCDLCEQKWGDSCAADCDGFDCDINYRKSLMKQWLESEV